MNSKITYGTVRSVQCPHCRQEVLDCWDHDPLNHRTEIRCKVCSGQSAVELTIEYDGPGDESEVALCALTKVEPYRAAS